ncbi:hypothetical protein [Zhongshania borealis]|uniref:Carboxypeptidase regulatory-like domain-containing protein n=1 Tax=Zhongshania borealis TaxID=889488 RepID=A0ABP7WQV0_9GAMM
MRQIPKFQKFLLPLAIAASLAACGSDSSKSTASNSVGGTTSKGIIIGGTVNAYPIAADGTVDRATPLAEPAVTAEDGTYSLTLNSSYTEGTPLFIEISAVDGTTMRCDIAECGTVNGTAVLFGDTYPLASTFTMAATLPQADSGSVTVNVTPLTDIASQLTLQKVASGAQPSAAALASNAQIANRLGISGGLISQAIVDITNADAVSSASKDALAYNLKAAAAIAATLNGNSGLSLEDAVATLSNQFKNGGMADKETTASTAVTIEELLEVALGLINTMNNNGINSEELESADTDITAAELDAEQNGSTTASQGDIPDDLGSDGLIATKAFVKQVRDLANAGVITENQAAFADQVELAAQVFADDGDIVAEAMGLAINAIANAVAEYEDAEGTKPSTSTTDGITVSISVSGDTETYTINQDVSVGETTVALALNAVNGTIINEEDPTTTENTDGSTTYESAGTASFDLSVSGSAESSSAKLSIEEGSSLNGSFSYSDESTETETLTSYNETWDDTVTVEDAAANLIVILSQKSGDNPVSFTGDMSIELDLLNYSDQGEYDNSFGEVNYSDSEEYTETFMIDGLDITLSGEFSDSSNNVISATLAASLSNIDESCESIDSYNNQNGFTYTFTYECKEETEQDYAMASLSIIFDINLTGVADDINVNFSANRTGLESGAGSLDLIYGGKQLNLAYEGGDSVTISNHNDVTLVLTETEVDNETSVSGTISVDDEKFADVGDDSGAALVRYSDGSFETLM